MTPKDPFLEGTFWDKFWRPIRSRALLFTPEIFCGSHYKNNRELLESYTEQQRRALYGPILLWARTFREI